MPCSPDCEECRRLDALRKDVAGRAERRGKLAEKARAALIEILSEENQRRLSREQRVIITGSHGGRYSVAIGYSGNIYRLNDRGEVDVSFCAHPPMMSDRWTECPYEYAMVAQILALQTDEPGFLAVAN